MSLGKNREDALRKVSQEKKKKKKHEQIYQRDQTDCQVKPAKAGESEEEKKGQQVITF